MTSGRPLPRGWLPQVRGALDRYVELLARAGERTNLVGSTDPAAIEVHVQDSLGAAPELPAGARVVDLGSGAGFPGLPLAIARPDLRITLVEVRERRVHFLRRASRELGLELEIRRARIEEGSDMPFEFALMRAVLPMDRAPDAARPWLGARGELWLWSTEDPPPGSRSIEIERGRIVRLRVGEG